MPTYPGGKAGEGVYQWLISMMPPHDTYLECFLGAGAVLRNKRPAASTIGIEIDAEVLATWRGDEVPNLRLVQDSALTRLRAMRHWLDASCMVYLDPPYLMETRRFERQYYRHEFGTREEHEELLWVVSELRCPVMLSGYWSELYAERLKGWWTASLRVTTRGATMAEEWVWMNYPEPLELHDYTFLGAGYRERERIRKRQRRWRAKLEGMSTLERYALLATLEDLRSGDSRQSAEGSRQSGPDTAYCPTASCLLERSEVATLASPGGASGMRTSPPERAVRDRAPLETVRITAAITARNGEAGPGSTTPPEPAVLQPNGKER
jgi:DNA adenine methylase